MAMMDGRTLMCGNCGGLEFRILHVDQEKDGGRVGGGPFSGWLMVKCISCPSKSAISVTQPQLEVSFVEGSEGCLCPINSERRLPS